MIRAVEMAVESLEGAESDRRVGIELSQTSQICDRMVVSHGVLQGFYYFSRGLQETIDAAPLLAQVRMIKTSQEIERMRLANELPRLCPLGQTSR